MEPLVFKCVSIVFPAGWDSSSLRFRGAARFRFHIHSMDHGLQLLRRTKQLTKNKKYTECVGLQIFQLLSVGLRAEPPSFQLVCCSTLVREVHVALEDQGVHIGIQFARGDERMAVGRVCWTFVTYQRGIVHLTAIRTARLDAIRVRGREVARNLRIKLSMVTH